MTTLKDKIRNTVVEYAETPFDDVLLIRAIPDPEVLVEAICEVIKNTL